MQEEFSHVRHAIIIIIIPFFKFPFTDFSFVTFSERKNETLKQRNIPAYGTCSKASLFLCILFLPLSPLSLPSLSSSNELVLIYSELLSSHFLPIDTTPNEINTELLSLLVNSTVQIHTKISSAFIPTKVRTHYYCTLSTLDSVLRYIDVHTYCTCTVVIQYPMYMLENYMHLQYIHVHCTSNTHFPTCMSVMVLVCLTFQYFLCSGCPFQL